jgi:hypothetical protein
MTPRKPVTVALLLFFLLCATGSSTQEWSITISASNQLEPIVLGINPDATNDYDPDYDEYMQTPIQGKTLLILDDLYSTEINKNYKTWELSVGVPSGETDRLEWDPDDIPDDVTLTIDGEDMREEDHLHLDEGSTYLTIRATTVTTTTTITTTTTQHTTTTTQVKQCEMAGDDPPCGEVSLNEVVDFINEWAQDRAQLADVIALINVWAEI